MSAHKHCSDKTWWSSTARDSASLLLRPEPQAVKMNETRTCSGTEVFVSSRVDGRVCVCVFGSYSAQWCRRRPPAEGPCRADTRICPHPRETRWTEPRATRCLRSWPAESESPSRLREREREWVSYGGKMYNLTSTLIFLCVCVCVHLCIPLDQMCPNR